MKRIGFFISGIFLLGGSVSSGVFQKTVYVRAAEPAIRVLLTTTDFTSRYHESVTVKYNGKTITYHAGEQPAAGGTVRIPAQKDGICLLSVERQCGNPVYRGSLEIIFRKEGLLVINELELEEYLKGVVPSEMPSYYEKEALKAQAVCARTYAWKQIREHRMSEYKADVDDSVSSQVYGNVKAQKSTDDAVETTEGEILSQNGEPIEAYYFSTSAGVTSTDEIWGAGTASGYLKSVVCGFDGEEPWSRWTVEIPWDNIQERAAEKLGQDTQLKNIVINRKSESGAVTGLEVTGTTGSFEVKNEYEVRDFLSPGGCTITEKDGTETEGGNLLPSAYFEMETVPEEKICIRGSGYGHGVGMSQTAADCMAEQGYTYEEILDYFFKDITLENLG